MAHTPGPWTIQAIRDGHIWIRAGEVVVAEIDGSNAPDDDRVEADAQLIAAAPAILKFVREVALYSNDPMLAVKATNLYIAIVGKEPMLACQHSWGIPARANNRFGQRSTSLYETRCSTCGHTEVRNGLARLRREVINT